VKALRSEPLLHFLLLGAVLFGLHGALGGSPCVGGGEPVVVDAQLVGWLEASELRRLGRAPTEDELDAAIAGQVRDAVLLAEARRRGLDAGDTVVDRRLLQKMEFLLEGSAQPTDADLLEWLAEHPDRYAAPAHLAITQRYFSADRRADARADAIAARASQDPGDPFPLGLALAGPADRLQRDLGLRADLTTLPEGAWSAPLESAYGWHLVRVERATPARERTLAEVRDAVERDWLVAARAEARTRAIQQLVDRADVRITGRDQ